MRGRALEVTIAKIISWTEKAEKKKKANMTPCRCIPQIWTSCHLAWLPYQPRRHFSAASTKEVETVVGVHKNADKTLKEDKK